MRERLFDALKAYTGFDEDDSARLGRVALPAGAVSRAVDHFYREVLAEPGTRRHVPNEATVTRLKGTLCDWIESFFRGPHDQAYYEKRRRIGRRHVEIGLDHYYVFCAMALLREDLVLALAESGAGEATLCSMHKLIDIELAIMMETYQEERLRLEMLRESERVYRDLIEHAPEMILTIDRTGAIRHINRTALELLGYTVDRPPRRLAALLPPEQAGEAWHNLSRAFSSDEVEEFETVFVTARGEERTVEVRVAGLSRLGGEDEAMRVFIRDVTQARLLEAKLQEYRQQAEERRRLATIGQMVAGIAHEIRTPLQVLVSCFDDLGRGPGRTVERGRLALQQMQGFIQEILDYAKEIRLDTAPVDPRNLVASALADLSQQIAQSEVTVDTGGLAGRSRVLADPFRMKQVLVNVLRNGIEATPPGGRVSVETRGEVAGGLVTFIVRDQGRGIPPEDLNKLFVPFFTTKPRGTGLGLPIVHRLVQAHGGRIEIKSCPGVGTEVWIQIPAATQSRRRPSERTTA